MNIENKKQVATLLLALALGIVAVLLTSQYIKTASEQQTMMLAQEFEKRQSQKIAQSSAALVKEIDTLKGQINKVSQEVKNQQAAGPKGAQKTPTAQGAFSLRTPVGKRAMTVMIDSLEAVGGLISAGDFVDILGQINIPKQESKSEKKQVTTILFQNIQILAVGANYSGQSSQEMYANQQKSRSLPITLALSPEEVGLLTFAQGQGKLKLSLRSPAEQTTESLKVASWDALADYVQQKQGTELLVPASKADIQVIDRKTDARKEGEVKPFIQIFKGGKEL